LANKIFTNISTTQKWDRTKCGTERICGPDLNGDNLWIYKAYLQISDHCRVRVRDRVRNVVRVSIRVSGRLGLELLIVVYKLLEKVTKCGSIKTADDQN